MNELKQVVLLREKMKILQEEIIKIETLVTKINKELSPVYSDGSGKKSGNEDLIIELVEMKNEYLKESVKYAKVKRKIIKKIIKIQNKNQMVLLYRRYVLGMNLAETAQSMNITYKWAQELHKRGVNSYNNIV